jgi:hypothetical protein
VADLDRDADGELGVDVLIIGGGLMAHYLARQLVDRYRVVIVADPSARDETLDSEGYFSAGYDGNDVGRIQPARRAAGYWRLWAESNGVAFDDSQPSCLIPADDVSRTIRLWGDAALTFRATNDRPAVFDGGPLVDHAAYSLDNDVVLDPAAVLDELRRGLPGCRIEGRIVKFVMSPGATVEYVEVEADARSISISPRFTVLAAAAANAGMLNQVAMRLRDPARRKAAAETSNVCQAVRRRHVLALRGPELPPLSGHFGGLRITTHVMGPPCDRLWLVNPPVDDARTTLGLEDLRFDPPTDAAVVKDAIEQLLAISPELADAAAQLQWGVYVRRQTQHPMVATDDIDEVGQPVPAKIETCDIDGFMALWPSHESYAMIVGDVAAERIRDSLGDPEDFGNGLEVSDVAAADTEPLTSRWQGADFLWSDWESFATQHGYKRD